jgi:hypothetical protein
MRAKRPKTIQIEAYKLKVHPEAQRKLNPTKLKKLVANFDLDAIGVFHVVTDGAELPTYWVIDGQHRREALIRHGMGEWKVDCYVREDTDVARAADLFLKLNDRAVVAAFDKFKNEVTAGDPSAVGAKTVVENFGFKVDRQSADGHVACVNTIKNVYAADSGTTLRNTFEVLTAAYGLSMAATEGKLVEGVAVIVGKFNGDIDHATFVKKLAKYPGGAAGILGDAKGLRKVRRTSLSQCVAETVLAAYNSGRREENRLVL